MTKMGFVEKASVLPGIGLFVMPFDKRVPANDRIPAWNLFWAAIGAGQDLDSERLLRVVEVTAHVYSACDWACARLARTPFLFISDIMFSRVSYRSLHLQQR